MMTSTSALLPCVMKVLVPLSTQWSPSRTAVRARAGGVAAGVGLGQRPGAQLLAARQRRQPARLLRVGAEHEDVRGAEAVVRRDRQRDGRVDARELLQAEAVVDGGHPGAAPLLGELNPHQAQVGQLRDERARKLLRLVPLAHERTDLAFGELADRLPQQLLFVGELEMHGGSVDDAEDLSRPAVSSWRDHIIGARATSARKGAEPDVRRLCRLLPCCPACSVWSGRVACPRRSHRLHRRAVQSVDAHDARASRPARGS